MSKERYSLVTEYPKDEFFDNKQIVKFDAYEVIRTLNRQDQRIAELEKQLKEKDLAIDKFSKIDIWLIRKYGKKLYKDFNITNDDIDIKTFIKISQVFDNIYEEMNKEMPLMWFNYGFFGLPKLDKGE